MSKSLWLFNGIVLIVLISAVVAVIRAPKFGPLKGGKKAVIPLPSEIQEMRADRYDNLDGFPDVFNVLIPKERCQEVLSFFEPGREAWLGSELKEQGRITIKTKAGTTTTLIFYFAGPNPLCYAQGGVAYMHETERMWEQNKLSGLIQEIHVEESTKKSEKHEVP
jgi:hypothetical protein